MANLITVQLRRGEGQPWGFRLQGGKDFSAPLVLQRVNGGSVADQAGLMPGDALVKVNSTEVFNLRHKEAQDVIVAAGNSFELTVSRGTAWRPSVTPTGSIPSPSPSLPGNITPVTKTSLAATPQPVQHIGSGHNQAAKPFPAQQQPQQQQQPAQEQVNGNDPIKSIVNKQYNTPVAMYSDETIAETLSSQAEVLAGGVLGVNFKKNERVYSPANSEVYKLLHEQGDNPEPAHNHHQQPQQQVQQQQHYHHQQQQQQQTNTVVTKHVTAPVDKPPSNTNGLPAGQNICSSCDRLIVGVFVRIKDKNLHADCFKCATCGTSLKNQGYFNLNGKLYCDIHARLAALQSPPPGTNGMVPVTQIPKPGGQKTGVQAISAALNAHANLNGRSQSPYAANLHLPPPPPPLTTTTTSAISSGSSSTHQSPSHSRSSSTTSSSGYCNSSSLSPVQSNKVSPLHSRTSSENELHHYPSVTTSISATSGKLVSPSSGSDFSFPPPPPPPLLHLATGMENPEVVQQQQQPPVEAVDPAAFGPNGLAVAAEPTADLTDSGAAAPATSNTNGDGGVTQNEYGFFYKTMGGAVIRSVFPPSGAGSRYKNQNNITPKPFGAAPSPLVQPPSSFPPVAGSVPTPFSAAITGQAPAPAPAPAPVAAAPQPASYPPVQAPAPAPVQAPAPAPAPAAVAPAAPAAVPTPQESFYQKKSPVKQTAPFAPGAATTLLDSSVSKLSAINGNSDYRKQASNVLKEMLEARLKKHEATSNTQQQEQVRLKNKENLLSVNGGDTLPKRLLNPAHPMSRIIDMCDSATVPAPPPLPKATLPFQQPNKDLKPQPAIPNNNTIHVNSVVLRPKNNNSHNSHNGNGSLEETLAQLANRRKVSSELTSHARDRRSYVEKNNNSQTTIAEESVKKTADEAETSPLAMVNKVPICNKCNAKITTGPFITALGRIWCPDHFVCHNANCKRQLADIGFVEEKGDLYCEYCFEEFLAPVCSKCNARVKGDCLNAIGKQFHPECFKCTYCGKLFGNSPFFLEEGDPYCETDWNELFTTKCFACGFPVEAGDKWVEALNNNYHSQCFNCTSCKKNLEGQSFFAKGGRPFCKNHAR